MQDPSGNGIALEDVLSREDFSRWNDINPDKANYNNFFMLFDATQGNYMQDCELMASLLRISLDQLAETYPKPRALIRLKKEHPELDTKLSQDITKELTSIKTQKETLGRIAKNTEYPEDARRTAQERLLNMHKIFENSLKRHEEYLYTAYVIMHGYGASNKELFS